METITSLVMSALVAIGGFFGVHQPQNLGVSLFNVQQGGTGVGTFTSSQLIYGNGTTALKSVATTTLTASSPLSLSNPVVKVGGSNSVLTLDTSGTWSGNAGTVTNGVYTTGSGTVFEVPLTFGDGLTRTANDVDVDTTQNIAILSNLTGNGFVKTSGGTGTLSIDTTTYESALTAGDGLTRTANDFDLDIPVLVASGGTGLTSFTGNRILYTNFDGSALAQTASSTLFGVGTAGYVWSYQNGAAGWYATSTTAGGVTSVTGTWPVISSGGATPNITWGGLATSSPLAVASGLLYATGVNTLASVSTSSPIQMSITGNAATVTTNANLSGVVTSSGNTTSYGSQAAGVLGNAATGNTAPMATSTLYGAVQNGKVLAGLSGSLQYVATTTFSTGLTYAAGNVTFDGGASPGGSLGGTWASPTIDDLFLLNNGDVGTGVYDFGGATSFELPNGASPTVDTDGECAIDTTDGQLVCGNGGTTKVFDERRFYSFGYATSTAWTGTTTLRIAPYPVAGTLKSVVCTTDAGTVGVDLYYGPTPTHLAYIKTASTTATPFTWTTNNTPGANASSTVAFGTPASSPTQVQCTATLTITGT